VSEGRARSQERLHKMGHQVHQSWRFNKLNKMTHLQVRNSVRGAQNRGKQRYLGSKAVVFPSQLF
jgi:hypothetical protein